MTMSLRLNQRIYAAILFTLLIGAAGCARPQPSSSQPAQPLTPPPAETVKPAPPPEKKPEPPKPKEAPPLYPAYVMEQGKQRWGYLNGSGQFVIPPQYGAAEPFGSDGLAVVTRNEKRGLIDQRGNFVLEPVYDWIPEVSPDGRRTAKKGSTETVVVDGVRQFDLEGSITGVGWPAVFGRSVEGSWRYGYLGRDGRVVIEPQYVSAGDFDGGLAVVTLPSNKAVLIDPTGKQVRPLDYAFVRDLSEGLVIFQNETTKKYGYLSVNGEVVIPAKFTEARPFQGGSAIVNAGNDYFDKRLGLINGKGEFLIPAEYASLRALGEGLYTASNATKTSVPEQFLRKAILDQNGRRLTDFSYYQISNVQNGLISVSDDQKVYFIDKTGAKVPGLPVLEGSGSMSIQGEVIRASVDGMLSYWTRDGKSIWQPDRTVVLEGGLRVLNRTYRPNRLLRIEYPELTGLADTKVQAAINADLHKRFGVGSTGGQKVPGEKSLDSEVTGGYTVEQIKRLLIVHHSTYTYPMGAAHGMPTRTYYHIDLTTGATYGLADLFKKESRYTERLATLVAKQIANQKVKGVNNPTPAVRPDHPFAVTPEALKIYWYPYEIAPYSSGFPTFEIPWSDLQDLVNTDGAFWKSFH